MPTNINLDELKIDLGERTPRAEHDINLKELDLVERIARAAHEVNRTYCQQLGDDSQVSWGEAPDWQRISARAGVEAVIRGKAKTPEQQHESWMQQKLDDGWTHGPVKDPEKKTHPCMVPYEELPPEQQAKDKLFRAVVYGMLTPKGRT